MCRFLRIYFPTMFQGYCSVKRFAKLAKILPCLKIFRLLSDFSMFADWHYLFSKINRIMETIFVGTKISLDFSIMYFVPLIIYGVDLTISFVVDKLDSFFFKWQRVLEKKRNMNHNTETKISIFVSKLFKFVDEIQLYLRYFLTVFHEIHILRNILIQR